MHWKMKKAENKMRKCIGNLEICWVGFGREGGCWFQGFDFSFQPGEFSVSSAWIKQWQCFALKQQSSQEFSTLGFKFHKHSRSSAVYFGLVRKRRLMGGTKPKEVVGPLHTNGIRRLFRTSSFCSSIARVVC
jgi:hypothetical protein